MDTVVIVSMVCAVGSMFYLVHALNKRVDLLRKTVGLIIEQRKEMGEVRGEQDALVSKALEEVYRRVDYLGALELVRGSRGSQEGEEQ